MNTLNLLWDVLAAFTGSNGLHAFIESGVLAFFYAAVGGALLTSWLKNPPEGLKAVVATSNFSYVATAVAGLVLTAATGALGTEPTQLATTTQAGATTTAAVAAPATNPPLADPQRKAFQIICAWSYVGLGILCTMVFVISPSPHDLVKTIGLTTLGFAGTISATCRGNDPTR